MLANILLLLPVKASGGRRDAVRRYYGRSRYHEEAPADLADSRHFQAVPRMLGGHPLKVMLQPAHSTLKLYAIVWATIFAAAVSASAKEGETRECLTVVGGQVVCGDLIMGITIEQYEAGLKKRAEEIRAEEAEKRVQLQKLVEMTERATSAEKDSLRSQIAAVEAEKCRLEAESKGVADRLTNLQESYDGLVQKLAEANAVLLGRIEHRDDFTAAVLGNRVRPLVGRIARHDLDPDIATTIWRYLDRNCGDDADRADHARALHGNLARRVSDPVGC